MLGLSKSARIKMAEKKGIQKTGTDASKLEFVAAYLQA
jgi:hypothetical protein